MLTQQNLFWGLAALMGPTNLSPKHSGAITLLSTRLVSECPPVTLSPRRWWQMCRELLLSDPCRHTQLPQQCLHGTGKRQDLVHFTGKQGRLRACEPWQAISLSQTSLCVSYTSQNQMVTFWRTERWHDLIFVLLYLCGAGLSSDTGDPMYQGL